MMALGDKAGTEAVEKLTNETIPALLKGITDTIPKLTDAIERVVDSADKHIDEDLVQIVGSLNGLALTIVDDLHGILDRLNGTVVTLTVKVPERKTLI
jgi:hypothetical protein